MLVSVFGPSETAVGEQLYDDAERLGGMLAAAGFTLVSGGYEGVMEASSKGAREQGGRVVGVTAEVYFARGRDVNAYVTKEVRVKSAVDRLMELLDLPDACVAIGNSPGTMIEVLTLFDYTKKRFLPKKPIVVVGDEWRELLAVWDRQPMFSGYREIIHHADTCEDAVEYLRNHFGVKLTLPRLDVL